MLLCSVRVELKHAAPVPILHAYARRFTLRRLNLRPNFLPNLFHAHRIAEQGFAKQRACGRVITTLNLMADTHKVTPSVGCYTTALAACRKAQRWRDAAEIYEDALQRGIKTQGLETVWETVWESA